MDRNALSDRLPTGRLPTSWLPTDRLPGLGSDTDDVDAYSDDAVVTDSQAEPEPDSPVEIDLGEPEDTPSRREKLRKLLLVTALGGLGLAVLAALLRRVLGTSDGEDDGDADPTDDIDATDDAESESLSEVFETTEPDTETATEPETRTAADEVDVASELLTADAEGVAALIGLGFQLLIRALVGEDESDSPTA
jgi:hypothetical protein